MGYGRHEGPNFIKIINDYSWNGLKCITITYAYSWDVLQFTATLMVVAAMIEHLPNLLLT